MPFDVVREFKMSNKYFSFPLLSVAILSAITCAILILRGQSQEPIKQGRDVKSSVDREGQDFENQFPIVDLDAQESVEDDALRKERKDKNKRYDNNGFVRIHSSTDIKETVRTIPWQEGIAALPVSQSTVIVRGEVQSVHAYLSNDKSGVYTEIVMRVDDVLKKETPDDLKVGEKISLDRPGGFVKYSGGHKRLYRIYGMNIPRVGQRYLFFLNKTDQSKNYRLLTGYQLSPLGVTPLDIAPQFDAYKDVGSDTFLEIVRNAMAQTMPVNPND